MADDLPFRLVVQDDARQLGFVTYRDLAPANPNEVAGLDPHADQGDYAVDLHFAGANELFHLPARAQPCLGQHFMDLLRPAG